MGVEISDVLFNFLPTRLSRCGSLGYPSWVTQELEDYLNSDSWREMQKGDFMLYDSVNQSLDKTIEKLGRSNVQLKLERYLRLIDIGTTYAVNNMNYHGCGIPFCDEN